MNDPHCTSCTCTEGRGRIDTAAPFYALVIEIDRIIWEENRMLRRSKLEATT